MTKEERLAKQAARLREEEERTHRMYAYERDAGWGALFIAGVDEVGRGPLAGPVVAGAVILPADHEILRLNDSKKLSEKRREEMNEIIRAQAALDGRLGPDIHEDGRLDGPVGREIPAAAGGAFF